jgi:hypothetical protein
MGKVLHASGSGYFPGCIQEGTDSVYAVWPLEQAMQTYWRVRAWDFNADIVVRFFDYPDEGENTDIPFTTSLTDIRSVVGDEEELVCNNNEFFKTGIGSADLFFFPVSNLSYPYRKVGDLYYSGFGGFIEDNSEETEFSFWAGNGGQFSISILGATLAIGADYMGTLSGGPHEVISCTASLTPSEWWSYGGTYDTATGNPL